MGRSGHGPGTLRSRGGVYGRQRNRGSCWADNRQLRRLWRWRLGRLRYLRSTVRDDANRRRGQPIGFRPVVPRSFLAIIQTIADTLSGNSETLFHERRILCFESCWRWPSWPVVWLFRRKPAVGSGVRLAVRLAKARRRRRKHRRPSRNREPRQRKRAGGFGCLAGSVEQRADDSAKKQAANLAACFRYRGGSVHCVALVST